MSEQSCLSMARKAVKDMITNFWYGDRKTGHILHVANHGIPLADQEKERGRIWESAMILYGIYDMWKLTGDPAYQELVLAEARFYRERFTYEELVDPVGPSGPALDDCAWTAILLLCFYQETRDEWFLKTAIDLLDNANVRWYDKELGGIHYSDWADFMALYGVGVAISWVRIWELTGQQRFYDLALDAYEGMHKRLGADRTDGLYFCEASVKAPVGCERPNDIQLAGSVSFLAGNMGMAALAARFYRATGEQKYLDRVRSTNEGLLVWYNLGGVLINDRDAWTNGAFAAHYASQMQGLPETEQMMELLKNTACSIMTNARTADGYYGASWQGPAEGEGSLWWVKGSVPRQSMTTATTVLMVVAAAIAEADMEDYMR